MRGSPSTSCVSFANAFRLSFVVAFSAPCATFAAWRPAFCVAQLPLERLGVEGCVPDVEVAGSGELPHPVAVRADRREHGGCPLLRREVAVTAGDLEARGEPLQVPLERAWMRLVEVVQVEDELALGGGVASDVGEVGVAAKLRVEAYARRRGEVVRHDRRRAAVERERGDEHPAVAHRDELGYAGRRLRLENRDGVAVCRELETGVARARALDARRAAASGALLRREVRHLRRGFLRVLGRGHGLCTLRRWAWG